MIDGAFRSGYDSLNQPMSALSLGTVGWLCETNFIVFGVIMVSRLLLRHGQLAQTTPRAQE